MVQRVLGSDGYSGNTCATTTAVVSGLPGNWAPYSSPIDTDCNKSDPAYTYYGDDEVSITLPGKSPAVIAYSPGPQTNPFVNPLQRAVQLDG